MQWTMLLSLSIGYTKRAELRHVTKTRCRSVRGTLKDKLMHKGWRPVYLELTSKCQKRSSLLRARAFGAPQSFSALLLSSRVSNPEGTEAAIRQLLEQLAFAVAASVKTSFCQWVL